MLVLRTKLQVNNKTKVSFSCAVIMDRVNGTEAECLAQAFSTTGIDYCNALFSELL